MKTEIIKRGGNGGRTTRIRECKCGAEITPQQGFALHWETECSLNPQNNAD